MLMIALLVLFETCWGMEAVKTAEAQLWGEYDPAPIKGIAILKDLKFPDEKSFPPPNGQKMNKPRIESANNFLRSYEPPEQRFRIPTMGDCCLTIMPSDKAFALVCKRHKKNLLNLSYDDAFEGEMALQFLLYRKYSTCDELKNGEEDKEPYIDVVTFQKQS